MARSPFAAGRRAFTLIEVLVVVAIIALLISILLPSLKRARDNARSAHCKANLHQAGIALNMYLVSGKEWFPRGGDPYDVYWIMLVAKMLGDKTRYTNVNELKLDKFEAFHCTARNLKLPYPFVDYVVNALPPDGISPDSPGSDFNGGGSSKNPNPGHWSQVKYSKINVYQFAAKVVYLIDAEDESRNVKGGSDLTLQKARENWATGAWKSGANGVDGMDIWLGDQLPQGFGTANVSDAAGPRRVARKRHMDRFSNAAFMDGHVDGLPLENRVSDNSPVGNFAVWLRRFGIKERWISTDSKDPLTVTYQAVKTLN